MAQNDGNSFLSPNGDRGPSFQKQFQQQEHSACHQQLFNENQHQQQPQQQQLAMHNPQCTPQCYQQTTRFNAHKQQQHNSLMPQSTMPQMCLPGVSAPQMFLPDVSAPQMFLHGVSAPSMRATDATTSNLSQALAKLANLQQAQAIKVMELKAIDKSIEDQEIIVEHQKQNIPGQVAFEQCDDIGTLLVGSNCRHASENSHRSHNPPPLGPIGKDALMDVHSMPSHVDHNSACSYMRPILWTARWRLIPVSYTHLTLPTNREV